MPEHMPSDLGKLGPFHRRLQRAPDMLEFSSGHGAVENVRSLLDGFARLNDAIGRFVQRQAQRLVALFHNLLQSLLLYIHLHPLTGPSPGDRAAKPGPTSPPASRLASRIVDCSLVGA